MLNSRALLAVALLVLATTASAQFGVDDAGDGERELFAVTGNLTLVETTIPAFERELMAAGAPWVPGGKIP